jgi:hypothetical protein
MGRMKQKLEFNPTTGVFTSKEGRSGLNLVRQPKKWEFSETYLYSSVDYDSATVILATKPRPKLNYLKLSFKTTEDASRFIDIIRQEITNHLQSSTDN